MFLFPVVVNTYFLSFVCVEFDTGPGSSVSFLASDMSIECETDAHHAVKVPAWCGILIVVPYIIANMIYSLLPIRHILENRTGRKCSPLIDL